MFQRFDDDARAVLQAARRAARDLGHRHVGTEHLLLGLLEGDTGTTRLLARHGVDQQVFRRRVEAFVNHVVTGTAPDALLASIGINVDDVRRRAEATFGETAVRQASMRSRRRWFGLSHSCRPGVLANQAGWTPRAKRCFELAHQEAVRGRPLVVTPDHLLLGILMEANGLACQLLVEIGVSLPELEADARQASK